MSSILTLNSSRRASGSSPSAPHDLPAIASKRKHARETHIAETEISHAPYLCLSNCRDNPLWSISDNLLQKKMSWIH